MARGEVFPEEVCDEKMGGFIIVKAATSFFDAETTKTRGVWGGRGL